MDNLLNNRDKILKIKEKVNNLDNSLFEHYVINHYGEIYFDNYISIVMTASNRSKQTYFTLQSMLRSKCKNIHIILVDDSDTDPINLNILKNFPYYIDFISIKRENKDWINPVVNYNIGFKYIKGNYVVIQNAEVCYVGDPLYFISTQMEENNYYVFDVIAVNSYENNEEIYKSDLTNIDVYNKCIYISWYQHRIHRNGNLHFFTAMKYNTFNKIKEFSYDYSCATDYDDNDFLLKIIYYGINVINIDNEINNIGGIHQYHINSDKSWARNVPSNMEIFNNKQKYYENNKIYIDITKDENKFNDEFNRLKEIGNT